MEQHDLLRKMDELVRNEHEHSEQTGEKNANQHCTTAVCHCFFFLRFVRHHFRNCGSIRDLLPFCLFGFVCVSFSMLYCLTAWLTIQFSRILSAHAMTARALHQSDRRCLLVVDESPFKLPEIAGKAGAHHSMCNFVVEKARISHVLFHRSQRAE